MSICSFRGCKGCLKNSSSNKRNKFRRKMSKKKNTFWCQITPMIYMYLERENYFQSIIWVHICVKPSTLPKPLPVASAIESAVVAAGCWDQVVAAAVAAAASVAFEVAFVAVIFVVL